MKTATNDNLLFGLGALGLLIVCGAAVYNFYQLNWPGIILALLLTGALCWWWQKKFFAPRFTLTWPRLTAGDWLLVAFYLIFFLGAFYLLLQVRTDKAIVSPWQVIAKTKFFLLYLAAGAVLIGLALKKSAFWLALTAAYYWLSFSVVAIVYKIGYGFDPFIHQATLAYIDRWGQISPKHFYYTGQYALEIIIHKLTWLPLAALDKFLIMGAAALILPPLIWRFLQNKFGDTAASRLALLALLTLSFTPFIMTTPQSLAYVLVLAIVCLGQTAREKPTIWLFYLLSLAALLIQPIAGVPCLLLTAALHLQQSRLRRKELFYALILLLNIILLPAAFYLLQSRTVGATAGPLNFNLINWPSFKLSFPNQGSVFLNFAYLYGRNLGWLAALAAGGGIWLVWRERRHLSLTLIYLGQSATLLAAYFLTKLLPFNFLIDYEKNNYANRLLYLALLLLIPFFLTALVKALAKILAGGRLVKICFLAVLLALLGAALYISYPRYDRYYNSHGWATSAADVAAVRAIAADSPNLDYAVLANQQVSAAALRLAGFAKYYQGSIFYYPIPTGGPLYQDYLTLTKQPTIEPIMSAMNLTGVDKVYVVINSYWTDSKNLIKVLKTLADSQQIINNGEVYIFKFNRQSLIK